MTIQSVGVGAREKSGDRSQESEWKPGNQKKKNKSIMLNGTPKCRSVYEN